MPSAEGRGVHIDSALSEFASQAFAKPSSAQGYVADFLAPAVPVDKQSNVYYSFSPSDFMRVETAFRAPATVAREVGLSVNSEGYFAKNYALTAYIPMEDLANQDRAVMLEQNRTSQIVGLLGLAQEIRVANLLTSISNVGSGVTLSGTTQFSDFVNSDPLGVVSSGVNFIQQQTGLLPNTMVLDWTTANVLSRHPALLDIFKYTEGGIVTAGQMATAFGIDRVLIARAMKENAKEGLASSRTAVWNRCMVLAHIGDNIGLETAAPAVRFQWQSDVYPSNMGVMSRDEGGAGQRKVRILECGHYQDEKIVGRDLAYTILGAVA